MWTIGRCRQLLAVFVSSVVVGGIGSAYGGIGIVRRVGCAGYRHRSALQASNVAADIIVAVRDGGALERWWTSLPRWRTVAS